MPHWHVRCRLGRGDHPITSTIFSLRLVLNIVPRLPLKLRGAKCLDLQGANLQTKKGNQWHFGMKAHIGVDAKSGLTHSLVTTAANEHDLNQLGNLLHGEEQFVSADAGYQGAPQREELAEVDVDWLIAERPGKVRTLKQHPRKNKTAINIEYMKASIRARVEHPFRIIKRQFGFVKARYKGLLKNDNQLAMLFTLANLFRVDQMIRQWERSH